MGIASAEAPAGRGAHGRLLELDALRGLAALAVVLYHYLDRHEETIGHVGEPLLWVPWGAYGVRLFFIISGFVIFMTLDRTRRPLDFVVSRFARLYPAYWAALAFTTAVVLAAEVPLFVPTAVEVAVNTTMAQSLFLVSDVEGAYWTLFVELCFYVVMLGLFASGQLRHIERWLVAALGVVWFVWLGQVLHGEFGWSWRLTATFGDVIPEIPFFVIGITLYRVQQRQQVEAALWLMMAALVTVALQRYPLDAATALLGIGAFALIMAGRAALLRHPLLVFFGTISYTLYLVHNYAGRALIARLQEHGWGTDASVLAALLLAITAAALLTYLIERPAQRAIVRWHRRRSARAPSAGAAPGAPV